MSTASNADIKCLVISFLAKHSTQLKKYRHKNEKTLNFCFFIIAWYMKLFSFATAPLKFIWIIDIPRLTLLGRLCIIMPYKFEISFVVIRTLKAV